MAKGTECVRSRRLASRNWQCLGLRVGSGLGRSNHSSSGSPSGVQHTDARYDQAAMEPKQASLADFTLANYSRSYQHQRGALVRWAWMICSLLVFESGWIPLSSVKRLILRWFGAKVGRGVVIKPHVRIKYPWLLEIGDHCWIGEQVWVDNLAPVSLGSDVCLSQLAYLCTGSHDPDSPTFDLITRPIRIERGGWIAARATVLGGVTVHEMAVVAACALAVHDIPAHTIAGGNPAKTIRKRG